MHPKNVPIVVVCSMILGAALVVSWLLAEQDLMIIACMLISTAAGLVMGLFLHDNDIITLQRFNQTLEAIQAEIKAHREDHDIRAYDPKSVGQSIRALAEEVSKLTLLTRTTGDAVNSLDSLLRSRIQRQQSPSGARRDDVVEPDP